MKRLSEFWDEKTRFVFITAVILIVAAHGFCFINIMYSHDSLAFWRTSLTEKVSAGRWLVPYFIKARKMATPWLMGVCSTLYISLAVVLVTKIFEFDKLQGVCVAVIFSANLALAALLCTCIHEADADSMGILFACFAVYAFKNFPKVINLIVSIVSMVLCLAIYQAHICVALGLFVMFVIYKTKDIKDKKEAFNVFLIGVKGVIATVVAFVLYMLCMNRMAARYGVRVSTDYNGLGEHEGLSIGGILKMIPKAYGYFTSSFLSVNEYNTIDMVKVYRLLLLVILVAIITYIWINKPLKGGLVLTLLCILALPLALNAIYIVSFELVNMRMIYAFPIVLLLPMVLANMTGNRMEGESLPDKSLSGIKKGICVITAVSIIFIGFNNMIYFNDAYLYQKLVYDNTVMHVQKIWKDINNVDGYVEGETEVDFMGEFVSSEATYNSSVGEKLSYILTGENNSAITYAETVSYFFYAILGHGTLLTVTNLEVLDKPEFKEMPAYPEPGYCRMIDGRVAVKMSNIDE